MQRAFVAILIAALAACGSNGGGDEPDAAGGTDGGDVDAGSGDVTCAFSACGGDPIGTWSFANACISIDLGGDPGCPEATFAITGAEVSGTLSLMAGGAYTVDISSVLTFESTTPASCLPQELSSCAELEDQDTTCTGNPDVSCTCTSTEADTDQDTGTWSTDGNTITLDEDPAELCVDGDVLKIRWSDGAADEMVLVLTR